MASAKQTPKVSRISRGRTLAYARKQKPTNPGDGTVADEESTDASEDAAQSEPAASASASHGAAAASAPG
ncbi:MAG TPA: hypothetical protein VGD37_25540, partial [Kofleriaceae bacterium]